MDLDVHLYKGRHQNRKSRKFGTMSQKNTEMSQFQFGNFENRGGGVSIFQKCPNLNYFAIILQFCLYKKCMKLKKVPIWSEGGVNIFQNCPKFKNVPKVGGGRVNSNWEIDPNFLDIQF